MRIKQCLDDEMDVEAFAHFNNVRHEHARSGDPQILRPSTFCFQNSPDGSNLLLQDDYGESEIPVGDRIKIRRQLKVQVNFIFN